jgi:tripartite ATP-independent transporter DctP family solute receptor
MFKVVFILISIMFTAAGVFAQPRVLKWAHVYEPSEHYHLQAVGAANEIERLTQGRVRIEVIPASKAGAEETFPAKLKSGEIDIAYLGMTHATKEYAPLSVSGFPFIFQDSDHVQRYLNSPFFKEQLNSYEKAVGNHMVTAVYYGARHVTENRPIARPEDMVNLKLRVPGAPAYKLFGQAMQAQSIAIPFAKVYDALKNGDVEAQENPLPTIYAKKFYEVQKFAFLTAHIYDLISITVGQATWKSLSVEDQKIVDSAIKKAATWVNVQTISNELLMESELRKLGMRVVSVDRKAFRDVALKNASPTELGATMADYQRIQSLARTSFTGAIDKPAVTERKK